MGVRGETRGGDEIEAAGVKYGSDCAACRGLPATASSAASVFKPGIAAGVSLAALAGMALGAGGLPELGAAIICIAAIMLAAMGAGGMNSVLDRGFDRDMPRVGGRLGALSRMGAAPVAAASACLVAVSLALAYASFGVPTAALILAAVLSYTVLYTLYLKRRSPYGTVPGGLAGALPVLIGYSAASPALGPDGLILFAVMLLWQPPHFLALALKYEGEYRRAGLPVMPVALGERYTKVFMFMYTTALIPAGVSLWFAGGASEYFAVFSCVLGFFYLAATYANVVRRASYSRAFAASIVYIMALLTGLLADTVLFS